MLKRFLTLISSIKIKLFLWFWLITLVSFVATRLISAQLTNEQLKLPPTQEEVRKLKRLSKLIERSSITDLSAFINQLGKKRQFANLVRRLIIKDVEARKLILTTAKPTPLVNQFVQNNDFARKYSWQIKQFQLTGPITFSVNQKTYQLFSIQKARPPRHFGHYLMNLPYWARITIPLVISFMLCWLLARSLSKPIIQITDTTTKFGEGDYSARVTELEQRNDELGLLARSFDYMAEKTERNVTAQQRLLGDVSHELRSPLTRLQMALGLAENNQNNPEQLANYLQRSQQEVSRLNEMIGDVLELSRLENLLTEHQFSACNLMLLIQSIIDDVEIIAKQKQITIEFSYQQEIVLPIENQLLASAISNILNNALKYSPEHSQVTITITSSDKFVEISVADQGEGVPQSCLSLLFKPFYRVASARDRLTGGTGLGLAIAQQAANVHKGTINAKNNTPQGLTVTLKLPKQRIG